MLPDLPGFLETARAVALVLGWATAMLPCPV